MYLFLYGCILLLYFEYVIKPAFKIVLRKGNITIANRYYVVFIGVSHWVLVIDQELLKLK